MANTRFLAEEDSSTGIGLVSPRPGTPTAPPPPPPPPPAPKPPKALTFWDFLRWLFGGG